MPRTHTPDPQFVERNRLKEERLLRGWSQQEVADFVETTPLNVSRWERGFTTPTPYFRHRLSTVFGISAASLGLSCDPTAPSGKHRDDQREVTDPLIPFPLPLAPAILGRDEEISHLRRLLVECEAPPSLAL